MTSFYPYAMTFSMKSSMKWMHLPGMSPYDTTLSLMEGCVQKIQRDEENEQIWLLEHPPLYTRGYRTLPEEMGGHLPFPIFETGRGGKVTYHGPGQRVCYVMCDLKKRGKDIRAHVAYLENWGIRALSHIGIQAMRDEAGVGLWVKDIHSINSGGAKSKIAAIGVRVSKWITSHGIAFNINPDLTHFEGIIPCGIHGRAVTSAFEQGISIQLEEFDEVLKGCWEG